MWPGAACGLGRRLQGPSAFFLAGSFPAALLGAHPSHPVSGPFPFGLATVTLERARSRDHKPALISSIARDEHDRYQQAGPSCSRCSLPAPSCPFSALCCPFPTCPLPFPSSPPQPTRSSRWTTSTPSASARFSCSRPLFTRPMYVASRRPVLTDAAGPRRGHAHLPAAPPPCFLCTLDVLLRWH